MTYENKKEENNMNQVKKTDDEGIVENDAAQDTAEESETEAEELDIYTGPETALFLH